LAVNVQKLTDDPELRQLLLDCMSSNEMWAKTFIPGSFDGPVIPQRRRIFELLDDAEQPKTCIIGFRGVGKSTSLTAFGSKAVVFREARHIVYVSDTVSNAKKRIDTIKQEVLTNRRITDVFGKMKATSYEGVSLTDTKEGYYLSDPKSREPVCFISALGANQNPRGSLVRVAGKLRRPDLYIIDDLEDKETYLNAMSRKKTWEWFINDLLKSVSQEEFPNAKTRRWDRDWTDPEWKAPWRVVFLDTFKHEDAAAPKLMKLRDWKHVLLPMAEEVVDEETGKVTGYTSLIPELRSDAQVCADANAANEEGNLDGWSQEMLCKAMASGSKRWTRKMFQYYSEAQFGNAQRGDGLSFDRNTVRFIIVDPTRSTVGLAAAIAVGVNAVEQKIYLRGLVDGHLQPEEMVDKVFGLGLKTNTRMIFIETTGQEDLVKHLYINASAASNGGFQFDWLSGHDGAGAAIDDMGGGRDARKRMRGGAIQPYYKRKYVYHEDSLRDSVLESTLLDFPKCTFWEYTDCLGYIIEVMIRLNIHWRPKNLEMDQFDLQKPPMLAQQDKRMNQRIRSGAWCSMS